MMNMEELQVKYQKYQEQVKIYHQRLEELNLVYKENISSFKEYDCYESQYKQALSLYHYSNNILIREKRDFVLLFGFVLPQLCTYILFLMIMPYVWFYVLTTASLFVPMMMVIKDLISLRKSKKIIFEYRLKKRKIEQYLWGTGRQVEMKRTYLRNEICSAEYQLKIAEKNVQLYEEAIELSMTNSEIAPVYTKEQLETLRQTAILTKEQLQEKIDLVFVPKSKIKRKHIDTTIIKDKGNIIQR